jgi:hypothetical protein
MAIIHPSTGRVRKIFRCLKRFLLNRRKFMQLHGHSRRAVIIRYAVRRGNVEIRRSPYRRSAEKNEAIATLVPRGHAAAPA